MGEILDQFVNILCGDLDNSEQLANEEREGIRVHPYAKHITRICNQMIKNLPEDLEGIYILEESYYTYPDRPREVKPLFFYIREVEDGVLLQSIIIPKTYNIDEVTNDNANLKFEFAELHPNEKFGTAHYKFNIDHFTVDHHCDFGHGITFRLVETLTPDRLEVMEMYMNAGELMTPYTTPLIYKKMN